MPPTVLLVEFEPVTMNVPSCEGPIEVPLNTKPPLTPLLTAAIDANEPVPVILPEAEIVPDRASEFTGAALYTVTFTSAVPPVMMESDPTAAAAIVPIVARRCRSNSFPAVFR